MIPLSLIVFGYLFVFGWIFFVFIDECSNLYNSQKSDSFIQ